MAVSSEALRSSEISLLGSLHDEATQKTLIFILFIQILLPAYCTMFFLLLSIAPTCFGHNSYGRPQGAIKFVDLYP